MEAVSLHRKSSVNTDFDIVVSGGGMAGSTLVWALLNAQPELKIALIEQQPQHISPVSFDSRSIALSAGSRMLLERWQLWPAVKQFACAIKQIKVSDQGHFGKTRMTADEYQQDALGYVIEVEHLGRVLHECLANCPQLTVMQGSHITELSRDADCCYLTLQDGRQLSSKLLVIAEGGQSPSRELAGFSMHQQNYGQHAIIANLALRTSHQHKAFERFTAQGPAALLPLPDNRYSLVLTVNDDQVQQLMQLPDEVFMAHVQQVFGYRAGQFSAVGKRAQFALSLRLTDDIVSHRIALLGNSLHTLHPIAGQGFNLALRDIAQLVKQIETAPQSIGDYAMLNAYQKARKTDIGSVSTATDALVRLFSNRSRAVALLRNTGLLAMTLCDELKRPLAVKAMGFDS